MSLTHIAGLLITINDEYMRQRCAWCGYLLLDYDLKRVAVPTGTDPTPGSWEMGSFVCVEGGAKWVVGSEAGVPANSCTRNPLTSPKGLCDAT